MRVEDMRLAIAGVYDGVAWKAKVWKMPDYQVIAIYHNFRERRVFEQPKKKPVKETYHQINMFDYMKEKEKENANS